MDSNKKVIATLQEKTNATLKHVIPFSESSAKEFLDLIENKELDVFISFVTYSMIFLKRTMLIIDGVDNNQARRNMLNYLEKLSEEILVDYPAIDIMVRPEQLDSHVNEPNFGFSGEKH